MFDEKFHYSKYGKKWNWTNIGKNKQEKADSQSHNTIHHYQPAFQIWLLQLDLFQRNLWRNISSFKVWKDRKSTNTGKNKQEKAGSQSNDTIHHYQPAYQIWLQGFTEIFDTKNFIIESMERKKIRQIQGEKRMRRLVHISMIQYIIIDQHTKNDYSSLHSFTESLKENFILQSMERKEIGQMLRRISNKRLVRNPTIKYIIIILHTKYDYSSFHGFPEIFDEKFHYSKYCKRDLENTKVSDPMDSVADYYIPWIGQRTALPELQNHQPH